MICNSSTTVVVRFSSGTVIHLICCHGVAPSTEAASYSSRGMSCRPAR